MRNCTLAKVFPEIYFYSTTTTTAIATTSLTTTTWEKWVRIVKSEEVLVLAGFVSKIQDDSNSSI